MKITQHIPNFFTSLNLLSGCFGIVAVAENQIEAGVLFIISGAIFDFFDGFFARLLRAGSGIGKELDSLADMVTFGFLPAYMMYSLFTESTTGYYPYISFLLAVSAGFRLAKFNISEDSKDYFVGLPTPANAFLIAGLVHIYLADWESFNYFFNDPNILMAYVIIQSFLMNSNIQFISLKFKESKWKGNELRYLLIICGLILIIFLQFEGLFMLMLFYLFLSIYQHIVQLFKSRA
jgi:CDP-diacylglycerol--serine O-phosphatidyltransferase